MLLQEFLPTARERLHRVELGASILQAARALESGREMLLVCDGDGRMAGVMTKTDVVRQTGRCSGASCTAPVVEACTSIVSTTALVLPGTWPRSVR